MTYYISDAQIKLVEDAVNDGHADMVTAAILESYNQGMATGGVIMLGFLGIICSCGLVIENLVSKREKKKES